MNPEHLRKRAAMCDRLARCTTNVRALKILRNLAHEYRSRAEAMATPARTAGGQTCRPTCQPGHGSNQ